MKFNLIDIQIDSLDILYDPNENFISPGVEQMLSKDKEKINTVQIHLTNVMNRKEKLLRLGHRNPEELKHIKPFIDEIADDYLLPVEPIPATDLITHRMTKKPLTSANIDGHVL